LQPLDRRDRVTQRAELQRVGIRRRARRRVRRGEGDGLPRISADRVAAPRRTWSWAGRGSGRPTSRSGAARRRR
jgi:hypothetical protein